MRSPTYVIHKFIGLALPAKLGIGGTAGERGQPATSVRVRTNFSKSRLVLVAVQQIEHGRSASILRIFYRDSPAVKAATESAQDFKFGSVITL